MLAQSLPQKQHQEIQNAGEAGQGFPESVHPAPGSSDVLSSGSTSFCVVLAPDGELAGELSS